MCIYCILKNTPHKLIYHLHNSKLSLLDKLSIEQYDHKPHSVQDKIYRYLGQQERSLICKMYILIKLSKSNMVIGKHNKYLIHQKLPSNIRTHTADNPLDQNIFHIQLSTFGMNFLSIWYLLQAHRSILLHIMNRSIAHFFDQKHIFGIRLSRHYTNY